MPCSSKSVQPYSTGGTNEISHVFKYIHISQKEWLIGTDTDILKDSLAQDILGYTSVRADAVARTRPPPKITPLLVQSVKNVRAVFVQFTGIKY